MANVSSEADRLLEAGRKKILHTCFLCGGPLLAILVLAGLQGAGAVHLEEYMAVPPQKVDQQVVWSALGTLALFPFLGGALGVFQGCVAIRRAKHLRQQSAPSARRNKHEDADGADSASAT
jgi:hypothetical protein